MRAKLLRQNIVHTLLFALCSFSLAQLPVFVPYSNGSIHIQVPESWQSETFEDGTVRFSPNLAASDAPELQVWSGFYNADLTPKRMTGIALDAMNRQARALTILGEDSSETMHVTMIEVVLDKAGESFTARVVLFADVDMSAEVSSLILFAAKPEEFDTLGGLEFLLSVLGVPPQSENTLATGGDAPDDGLPLRTTLGAITSGGEARVAVSSVSSADGLPASGPVSLAALLGEWRSTELMSTLDSSYDPDNEGADESTELFSVQGSTLTYVFAEDGNYTLGYGANLTSGVFMSATQVREVGKYSLADNVLTVQPAQYEGWISVMNGEREPVYETNIPSRSYGVAVVEDFIVLTGVCAEFQVDAYCEDGDDNKLRLEFAFKRIE
jgi:hypothetical protein